MAVQKALVGQKRSDFGAIIKTFGEGVVEAHLDMRPFWKATLPNTESKILVSIVQPEMNPE